MPKVTKTKQSRNWCFTDFDLLNISKIYETNKTYIRYMCWGRELCPTTGREHNQGWIQFQNKKRLNGVRGLFLNSELKIKVHLETCMGSPEQNDKYCKKGGDWQQHGKYISQGCRTDMERICADVLCLDKKLSDIMVDNPGQCVRYHKGFEKLRYYAELKATQKSRKVHVNYIHGVPGTGKTTAAMGTIYGYENTYKIAGHRINKWWDGYEGQPHLVIDDLRERHCDITKLLEILDNYPIMLEVKGSHTISRWHTITITSNTRPDDWYPWAADLDRVALMRRIDDFTEL